MKISASLICSPDLSDRNIKTLEAKSDYLHYDIMDPSMTDCKGLSVEGFLNLSTAVQKKAEIHIMSKSPLNYIDSILNTNCGTVIIHIESDIDFQKVIFEIKKNNMRVGLAISPSTPIEDLYPFLSYIDVVTVLTVNPGRAGQIFQKRELNKVVVLEQLKKQNNYTYEIEVDGSCNSINYGDIYNAGTEVAVVGTSGLFSLSEDLDVAWKMMSDYMKIDDTIYMHADLVGNPLKESIKSWLKDKGYSVCDLYTDGVEEYPECARLLSEYVAKSKCRKGILCCGTGLGMSMVANRVPGIRAAVVSDLYTAKMSREHNDANVLCLGSRVTTKEISYLLVDSFLNTRFLFGKHTPRVDRFD